jgi:hypothetical protein
MAQKLTMDEIRRSDPFLKGDDVHLDTSQFPHLTPLTEQTFEDDKFAPLIGSGSQDAKDLRKFLTEQAAEQEGPAVAHVGDSEFRVSFKDGQWHADGEVAGKRHRYSAADRNALLSKLMKLVARKDTIQQLTEPQLLEVARIAGAGDRVGAINRYLEYAVPQALADKYDGPHQIVNDPALRSFMDDVCEYVWLNSRLDATDSEDWQDFKAQFVGQRPVSCALLDNAWTEFSNKRNRLVFAEPPRDTDAAPAVPERLDDLSDDAVDKLMSSTKREYVRAALAGRR